MNKSIHKLLGKLLLSSAALCWMSCDSESVSSPSSEPVPSSSSNPVPNSSSETPASSSSGPETSSSEVQANSSSSNNVPSSSSISEASSSSKKAPISCKAPTSSSSAKREPPQKATFDIEQTLSAMSQDTTGLIGQCIPSMRACVIQMESYDKNFYEYGLAGQERNHAMDFVNSELDSLLESPRGATFSEEKRNCILNLKYSYWEATPDYGIPPWYSCEDNGDVQIDEAYIRAILTLDSLSREEYKKILEETNEKAAECDALE